MQDVIQALNFLKKKVYSGNIELSNNYNPINESASGYVAAVDGGCCIIADGGNWILSKIKVASVHYDKGKRLPDKEKKEETYYTVIKNNVLSARTEEPKATYEHSIPDLEPDFNNIRELTEAPSVTMRTLEFKHALYVIKDLPKGSLLLVDGLLKGENDDQEKIIGLIEKESKDRGVSVVGFAKTFRHAVNGRNIIGSLIKERPDTKWYYLPIEDSDCFVVKLHDKSKYAYALNTFKHVDLKQSLALMSYYSTDPSFLGYPYPLLRVDADARISSHEKHLEKNKLRIICKKEKLDFIEYDEKSTDMHSIIDSQKYR